MTIFGEITYNKTIYQHKHNYKTYCYIDDFLGLKKYDYFDPYIKAFVLEYAAKYPCTKVAQIINDMIGNRIKIKEPYQYITKQTIRNIILNEKLSKPELQVLETPEDLYIMADEKYVSTQNNDNNDAMIKEIVIFDGREIKNKSRKIKSKNGNEVNSFIENSQCPGGICRRLLWGEPQCPAYFSFERHSRKRNTMAIGSILASRPFNEMGRGIKTCLGPSLEWTG